METEIIGWLGIGLLIITVIILSYIRNNIIGGFLIKYLRATILDMLLMFSLVIITLLFFIYLQDNKIITNKLFINEIMKFFEDFYKTKKIIDSNGSFLDYFRFVGDFVYYTFIQSVSIFAFIIVFFKNIITDIINKFSTIGINVFLFLGFVLAFFSIKLLF